MPAVFLTIDTELVWRHHATGEPRDGIFARSIEPAGVGVAHQIAVLARYGLKATFFVDPMPARVYGLDPFRRIVAAILDAGQEVQLHCHPNWLGAHVRNRSAHERFELIDYSPQEQRDVIGEAVDLLVASGAPQPIAFRGGSYGANDDTLAALAALGIAYDSSHNGGEHPWPSAIDLPRDRIAPVAHCGIVEVPVSLIEDTPGRYRNVQICALSAGEMRAVIDHAITQGHIATTIVAHSFELANRDGTRANTVHVARFEALCAMLADRRGAAPTVHFKDRPTLALDRHDRPLGPSPLRRRLRQAEQLWSNLVGERAA